jgi:hypothetical protein
MYDCIGRLKDIQEIYKMSRTISRNNGGLRMKDYTIFNKKLADFFNVPIKLKKIKIY